MTDIKPGDPRYLRDLNDLPRIANRLMLNMRNALTEHEKSGEVNLSVMPPAVFHLASLKRLADDAYDAALLRSHQLNIGDDIYNCVALMILTAFTTMADGGYNPIVWLRQELNKVWEKERER